VLVADDNRVTRELFAGYLTRAGADVGEADDGEVAVSRAIGATVAGRPYGVILMDLNMPNLDGFAATALLRNQSYAGKIIALTASGTEPDRDRCLASGFDQYLTKPINPEVLLRAVRGYLEPV
jgi:two-component system, chemotaxis family, CheB/CheR fusion protein